MVGRILFSWFDCYVAKGKANALTADEIPALEEEYRLVKLTRSRYNRLKTGLNW